MAEASSQITTSFLVRAVVKEADLSASSARRTLGTVKTTGRKITVASRLRRLDPDTVDNLDASEQTRLGESLAGSGDDGARLIADGGEDLLDVAIRDGGIDESVAARLRQLDAEGEFTDTDLQRLGRQLDDGDIDQDDVRRMASILETKDSSPLFDEDLTASDLLDIGAKNSDLSEAKIVVKDNEGRLRWTEPGSTSGGLEKIYTEHGANFFRAYDSVNSQDDVKRVLYDAIERSDESSVVTEPNPGGGTRYYIMVEEGKPPARVIVGDNGFIFNAFPDRDALTKFELRET